MTDEAVDIELFQSTLPVRGATSTPTGKRWCRGFQSTLPVRGATCFRTLAADSDSISIHAPREGSDCSILVNVKSSDDFNPRSP